MGHTKHHLVPFALQFDCIHELLHSRSPSASNSARLIAAALHYCISLRPPNSSIGHNSGLFELHLLFSLFDLLLLLLQNFEELLPLNLISLFLTDLCLLLFGQRLAILAQKSGPFAS